MNNEDLRSSLRRRNTTNCWLKTVQTLSPYTTWTRWLAGISFLLHPSPLIFFPLLIAVARYVSPSCEPLLGYTQQEMEHINYNDLVHSDNRNEAREAVRRLLELARSGAKELPACQQVLPYLFPHLYPHLFPTVRPAGTNYTNFRCFE